MSEMRDKTNGRLIYVIGASGAGKDSIMRYARERVAPEAMVVFAHRYITRAPDLGAEQHVAVSAAEFARLRRMNAFALEWESHGLCYGVGREIDLWMEAGATVVVNGSRGFLDQASMVYPGMRVVLLQVSPSVLRVRLQKRGRETAEQIEERLARAAAFEVVHPHLIQLQNDGPLDEAGEVFIRLIQEPNPEDLAAPSPAEVPLSTF